MKLNRIKLCFLLILIAVCSIAESASCSKERRSRRRSKSLNKSKAKTGPAGILEKFKNYGDKEYVLVFFGFLSKFFMEKEFDELAEKEVEKFPVSVKTCFGANVEFQKQQLAQTQQFFQAAEQTLGAIDSPAKKVRMCELMKFQARAVWMFQKEERKDLENLENIFSSSYGALDEIEKNGGVFAWMNYKWFTKKETICGEFTLDQTKNFVINKFGSIETYYNQCMFWLKSDCDNYDPESSNLTEFAKTAWGVAKSLVSQTQCVIDKIDSGNKMAKYLKPDLLEIMTHAAKHAAIAAGNAVLNYVTFGAWGGIKFGYHLIKLGIEIHDFFKLSDGDQTPYRVGKVLGTCAQIVKSLKFLVTGRRRRRRLMKY